MNPTEYSIRDLKEWKARRKETWDEQRMQVIFEGNGGIIYPTTLTTQPATQYIKTQTPITVNLTNHGSDARKNEPGTADTEHVMKIIGITIASLLTLIFIVLIVIWICRRSLKNHNKRVSIRRPLQSEDPDHVYAEIEPVSTHYIESPSTSFGAVPIQIKTQKRWSGVRYVSMHISRLFGTDSKRSATNDSIFFNKQSESVQVPPLTPAPDFPNEDRKGKRRAACQTIQSASRPLIDTDSQMLSTSTDVLMEMREMESVYNPLTRQTDSIAYDERKIGNKGSDAHITDQVIPGYPHDQDSHMYFILEKEEDLLDNDLLPTPTELKGLDEGHCNTITNTIHLSRPDEKCESKIDHDNLLFETTESSADCNYGKG